MPDGPERGHREEERPGLVCSPKECEEGGPFLGSDPSARDRGVQGRTEVHGLQHGRKVVEHDRGGFDPDVPEPGPAEVPAELPVGPPVGKAGDALVREAADHVRLARVEGEGAPVGFDRDEPPPRAEDPDEIGHDPFRARVDLEEALAVDRVEPAVRKIERGRIADRERELWKSGWPEPLGPRDHLAARVDPEHVPARADPFGKPAGVEPDPRAGVEYAHSRCEPEGLEAPGRHRLHPGEVVDVPEVGDQLAGRTRWRSPSRSYHSFSEREKVRLSPCRGPSSSGNTVSRRRPGTLSVFRRRTGGRGRQGPR